LYGIATFLLERAPMVMKLNVANLYDFDTGAGIHRH
jgi:hypothetical protein